MSEAPAETNPPNTSAPNETQTPENPNPQEPNVNPNPAAPQNPATTPQSPETGGNQPDLLAEIRALPERFAHVMSERNPQPAQTQTQTQTETKTSEEPSGPNGKGLPWDRRWAQFWFGQ